MQNYSSNLLASSYLLFADSITFVIPLLINFLYKLILPGYFYSVKFETIITLRKLCSTLAFEFVLVLFY